MSRLGLYVSRQADGLGRYLLEQGIQAIFGGFPTLVGIGLRALAYRVMLKMEGMVAIEPNVRIRFANHVRLSRGVYLDEGVLLHASPNGIEIGEETFVMNHAELHVYNFRGLPHAGIRIGKHCLIGEFNVLRGQGGITMGDRVYTSPLVQMVAVDHVTNDPHRPIIDQGITARGIVIDDDAWIGAGAIILDGVHVGRGAVVAAGAVVAQDVAPHTVVAGVPAKAVKTIDGTAPAPESAVFPSLLGGHG